MRKPKLALQLIETVHINKHHNCPLIMNPARIEHMVLLISRGAVLRYTAVHIFSFTYTQDVQDVFLFSVCMCVCVNACYCIQDYC